MADIIELWAADIDLLSRETVGDFLVIDRAVFALLIEWGFSYAELMEIELREVVGWHKTIASLERRRADKATD
jgi:hypothetical protein